MRPEEHLQQGVAAHQAGRLSDAERHYQSALMGDPNNFAAARMLGALYIQRQEFGLAEKLLEKAVRLNPRDAAAQQNHAATLLALKRADEAIAASDRALALQPGNMAALHIKASALMELARYDEAIAISDQALGLDANYAEGWYFRGNALYLLRRYDEAIASYDKLLARQPDRVDALFYRANALVEQARREEALTGYNRVLGLQPNFAQGFSNRGTVLLMLARPVEAVTDFDKALALQPDDADAWKKRGGALVLLGRPNEARQSYERAMLLAPDDAAIYVDMAYVLQQLGHEPAALAAFDKARALNPDARQMPGGRMIIKMHLCDWRDFEADSADLLARVERGEAVGPPFTLLAAPSTPAQQLAAAKRYIQDYHPALPPLRMGARYDHARLRVAYVSTDFRAHATAVLMMEPFEAHDRTRFETIAISLGPNDASPFRKRLESAFDRFIEARDMTDAHIADLMAQMKIDIAVDLNGHTQGVRTGIFARRPAPLQVNAVGYPGTMGADYYDYLIADRVLVPVEDEIFYSEKIAALPGSYQPNTRREIAGAPTRAACGLPEKGFVFCAFNNTFKITPDMFAVWMRLLSAVDDGVLWLQEPAAIARDNLRREAERHGVAPERLVFAPRLRIEEHLARYALADLFLDALYCNAHTTASDAIWCGLPLVTCKTRSFAGRVAASLLSAIGMDELITASLEEYETLALSLAQNPSRLAETKARLAQRRDASGLFDAVRYTRGLEQAYQTMWQRHQNNLPPESFTVRP